MSHSGADELIAARTALLDTLDALRDHLDSLIVVGAQAIYLHTARSTAALAAATRDSDLTLDTRVLADAPLLEEALRVAGFRRRESAQPGAWLSAAGVPVDLMVAEAQAGASGRRSARIPPHARMVARRTPGLEAALVDNVVLPIRSLGAGDRRVRAVRVAGPAALLVAKAHKLGERRATPGRLRDKDAYDIYRLLLTVPMHQLAASFAELRADGLSAAATERGLGYLQELFASGPGALGPTMVARATGDTADAERVALIAVVLAEDLLAALDPAVAPR